MMITAQQTFIIALFKLSLITGHFVHHSRARLLHAKTSPYQLNTLAKYTCAMLICPPEVRDSNCHKTLNWEFPVLHYAWSLGPDHRLIFSGPSMSQSKLKSGAP